MSCYKTSVKILLYPTLCTKFEAMRTTSHSPTQKDAALALLRRRGIARAAEFAAEGIAGTVLARLKKEGAISQLGRGLYQLADAPLDANQSLAEVAKHVPKGVICLVSALAFHGLTDTISSRVWLAIGSKDRRPALAYPPLQIVRFAPTLLASGTEEHVISGVNVRITNPAKTIVDLFRYRRTGGHRYRESPGLNIAIEGLREALRRRKATPALIAQYAREARIWNVVQPYLDAMTANA